MQIWMCSLFENLKASYLTVSIQLSWAARLLHVAIIVALLRAVSTFLCHVTHIMVDHITIQVYELPTSVVNHAISY